jgi:tetratricopeptide (TPR) repeat protein
VALDQKTGYLQSKGEWNNYRRMKWGAEHGWLYAEPEDLKLYQGRLRFVVFVADFYFATERFGEATEIYRRLLAGKFGPLSGAQRDYPQFALGTCAYWMGDRRRAFSEYVKTLESREGTRAELRAQYCAANISEEISDKEIQAKGMEMMSEIALSGLKDDFVYQAMINYGTRLAKAGKREEGIRFLKMIPEKEIGAREVAQMYLDEYAKAGEVKKGEGDAGKGKDE